MLPQVPSLFNHFPHSYPRTKGQLKSASFNELELGKCSNCGHQKEEHIYEQLVKQVESQNEKIKQLEVELAKKAEKEQDMVKSI